MTHDVLVIGGGAAGLNAALVLARARRRVAVVDAGEPRNAPAGHLHGFLSRDGMSPADLLAAGRDEVTRYGGELINDRVDRLDHGFTAYLAGGGTLTARAVLVATGLRDELPDIPGVRQGWGHTVLHCPYCHGWEVRDQPIGVLGGDNRPFTLHQASLVRQWSGDVVFFPHRIELTGEERDRLTARGVRIVDGEVAAVTGTGVQLAGGDTVPRAAVFVGPRFVPRDGLLTGLGCAVGDDGWVSTGPGGATSVDGVWAAGNVVSSPAQLVQAAGAGSAAAIAINHHLLESDILIAR
ncbi:NAD(P)/FAD-dependent oxidoreductase [Amycolatopsis suaedae]|uniref:NAD(P)/FAD-dependent oxidoreductase n=1 Tax=Amycolatopsis suaedae TaxID=2510978 RepID=A0A4Q7JEW0_9PSEU|nr:NAD(P)/FAD-dependent oxidoreductase [Amycolatopsis suaedae]RZQ66017.1 NAD(P)/FAD-dependent oxidoreductase [Amycolatopsis suaedae]